MATPTTTDPGRVRRAMEFDRGLFASAVDRVTPLPYGVRFETPSLPLVHGMNGVLIDREPYPSVADLAEVGIVVCDGPETIAALGAALLADGRREDEGVLMDHRGERPAERDPRVELCDRAEVVPLRRAWLEEEVKRPGVIEQILAGEDRILSQAPVTAWCIRLGGEPAATNLLIGDGDVRMIELVYTRPEYRGKGLASALVRTALVTAGGADLVFLPTDANGAARRLYESLGFGVLNPQTAYHRE